MKENHLKLLLVALLIALTVSVYWPAMGGTFVFDDYPNIIDNQQLHMQKDSLADWTRASLSGFAGPLLRPISMFTFAVNLEMCGLYPRCFKLTNLAIHVMTGLLLFLVVTRLLKQHSSISNSNISPKSIMLISGAIGLLWLLHPINVSSVAYVVQRMNLLAGLFVFSGLLSYLIGRQKMELGNGGRIHILAAFMITIPAMLSKENGALLPFFLLLVEIYFFKFRSEGKADRYLLVSLFSLSIALPVVVVLGFVILNPEWLLQRYDNREFSLIERILTQPRVLSLYLGLLVFPTNQRLSLFHDNFEVSTGLLEPTSTLLALLGLFGVVILICALYKRAKLLSFGLAFFLVGHLIESTIIPLEMVFEHRNYIPAFGILLPLIYYLYASTYGIKTINIRRSCIVILIVLFAVITLLRAAEWGNPLLLAELEAKSNPDSVRINNLAGRTYANAYESVPDEDKSAVYKQAHEYYKKAHELAEGDLISLASLIRLESRARGSARYKWYSSMLDILESKKLSASDSNAIKHLLACQRQGICPASKTGFESLIKAVEENPNQNSKYRAMIYTDFSQHYWSFIGDQSKALEYSKKAYSVYPEEIRIVLNYASILIANGDHERAEMLIQDAGSMDILGIHSVRIKELTNFVEQAK
ncbi:tetratricopeptide (TPR) repeat protein [Methylohalomonas lacus]|uniref:Tetratricopeptide (TPR) repeat protein n=1 Tax=Methylohalomonas lacus TaxID=398773 RepID=A0AAE3HNQ5_9GAMM|nr:hypothetical protein [Methylohalomonas lacus]MCS3903883.1 tetratricopeptide (TPR) repeat protein [Methylohalomonas lacus]